MKKRRINTYRDWKRQTVSLDDLLLDPDNIRLNVRHKDQSSILIDLFANEQAFEILKSIVESGFFPDEVPVVIKKDSKYVVLEGNRRVAALQALKEPQTVPQYTNEIKKITVDLIPITQLMVVVAPGRNSALRFLANKHTRRSRKPWKTLRQAYFYYAQYEQGKGIEQLRIEYSGVDIPRFVRMFEVHRIARSMRYDDGIARKVSDEKKFEISTLERIYGDPYVRERIGVSFDEEGHVIVSSHKDAFEKIFARIIADMVNGRISSRKGVRTDAERKKYIDEILPTPLSKSGKLEPATAFVPRSLPAERITKLDMRGINFSLHGYPAVGKMFDEIKLINYRKFPIATYDLIRSFLECALKAYLDYIGERPQKPKTKLREVLQLYAASSHTPNKLQQHAMQIRNNSNGVPYSVERMDMAQHNEDDFIKAAEVKETWEEFKSIFRHILNRDSTIQK